MTSLYGGHGPKHTFDHEAYRGLPKPDVATSVNSLLFDEPSGDRKYNKSVTAQLDEVMWQCVQDLIANKKLPFDGHMATLFRHALAMTIESLEMYLDETGKTLFRSMMDQQRRLTRERIIVTVDALIDSQVENLRFWTGKGDWRMVVRDMRRFIEEVKDYPEPTWREHTAQIWLRHSGVRALSKHWEERMKDDDLKSWQDAVRVQKEWEVMSGE